MVKTINDILNIKNRTKLSMVTAYDYTSSLILQDTDVDVLLVGDSAAMVMSGYESTLPISMDEMIIYSKSVTKANTKCLVIADMPFMSYQTSCADAVKNAGRFVKEAFVAGVKIEGGNRVVDKIKSVLKADIPVMGHLGLTPQSINQFGGYKVQGVSAEAAYSIYNDAILLEETGVFSLVLECVPYQIAKAITDKLSIPTIGIGAGPYCDGQVLVLHDLLGLNTKFKPKFVKQYSNLAGSIAEAVNMFSKEVKENTFPNIDEYSYNISEKEYDRFLDAIR